MANDDRVLDRYEGRIDSQATQEACRDRIHWMCSQVAGPRVLDVGCSQGVCATILAREGLEVVCLDIENQALERARQVISAESQDVRRRVDFVLADAYAVDFAPASFDTVLLGQILEHLTSPARLLERAHGWLRDAGRVIVTVPLGFHPFIDHKRSFYLANLLELLGERFNIVDVTTSHQLNLCAVGLKPERGASPQPPSPELYNAWRRDYEHALEHLQRKAHRTGGKLKATLEKRTSALAAAREGLERSRTEARKLKARLKTTRELLDRANATQVRLARSSFKVGPVPGLNPAPPGSKPSQSGGGFLFFCVNGAGLGHVTRSLSIARRIRRISPEMPIYFLSSSQALGLIAREEMIVYHIPSRSEYGEQMPGNRWNRMLLQQLRMIVELHRPAVLVYDGVSPYAGLMKAISEIDFVHTAMVLRLRHKHDRLSKLGDRLAQFDEMLFPGEPGAEIPPWLTEFPHRVFDPLVLLDRNELLPRAEARRGWHVSPDQKAVYVQLGAGNINDTTSWTGQIVSLLRKRDDVRIVLAESPIATRAHTPQEGVQLLSYYPNSLYFNGFDLAITATGYNTFHELMHFGVPSILIPNQETMTDDQVERARTAEAASAARVVLAPDELEDAIMASLSETEARRMRENAMKLVPRNGAPDVARHLLTTTVEQLAVRESRAPMTSTPG